MSDDFTPDDPIPALRAEIDQGIAMAPMLAGYARGLYDAFRAEDFGEAQALYLTVAHLKDSPGTAPK